MQLIVFRHGIAEDYAPDGSDEARALTPEGVRKTQAAAVGLATLIEKPVAILSSPKVRAKQTAAIFSGVVKVPVTPEPLLAHGTVEQLLALLARHDASPLVLVGHEPTLSQLVLTMMGLTSALDALELKKAGAACLTVTPGRTSLPAMLNWLVTPKMLRRLAAP
jgi:phosphohistidine phosphatase